MTKILIQTDGAADWHDRIGGWAYTIHLVKGKEKLLIVSNREPKDDTNNVRMEVTAIKKGLRMFEFYFGLSSGYKVLVETDSEWAIKCLNGEYYCTKNTDLLSDISRLLAKLGADIKWVPRDQLKVVDAMAREAMRDGKKKYAG